MRSVFCHELATAIGPAHGLRRSARGSSAGHSSKTSMPMPDASSPAIRITSIQGMRTPAIAPGSLRRIGRIRGSLSANVAPVRVSS